MHVDIKSEASIMKPLLICSNAEPGNANEAETLAHLLQES